MSDHIEIRPYNPQWPEQARQEISILRRIFDHASFPLIEHIGSTSVPGLDAKPVIDVVISCRDMTRVQALAPAMKKAGYRLWAENPDPEDHILFIKGPGRTHHVHVYPEGHSQIKEHLVFRNILRVRPDLAQEYQAIKYRLAESFRHDRDGYTEAKTDFIKKVLTLEL